MSDSILSPADDRIPTLIGSVVRITVSITDVTPFGEDTVQYVHEGRLVSRTLSGPVNDFHDVAFHFHGDTVPVEYGVKQFLGTGATFQMEVLSGSRPIDQ